MYTSYNPANNTYTPTINTELRVALTIPSIQIYMENTFADVITLGIPANMAAVPAGTSVSNILYGGMPNKGNIRKCKNKSLNKLNRRINNNKSTIKFKKNKKNTRRHKYSR